MLALWACSAAPDVPDYTVSSFDSLFEPVGDPSAVVDLHNLIALAVDRQQRIFLLQMATDYDPDMPDSRPRVLRRINWDGRDTLSVDQHVLDRMGIGWATHLELDGDRTMLADLERDAAFLLDSAFELSCALSLYDAFPVSEIAPLGTGHWLAAGLREPMLGWTWLHTYKGVSADCDMRLDTSWFAMPKPWQTVEFVSQIRLLHHVRSEGGIAAWNLWDRAYFLGDLRAHPTVDSIALPKGRLGYGGATGDPVQRVLYLAGHDEALMQWSSDTGIVVALVSRAARASTLWLLGDIHPLSVAETGELVCYDTTTRCLQRYRRREESPDA